MPVTEFDAAIAKSAEATLDRIRAAREAIGAVIFGQEKVVEQSLTTLLSGGHGLLIGVPGLAKTKLVESLGIVLGLDTARVQFTPDLMPADITGSEVMEESASGTRAFPRHDPPQPFHILATQNPLEQEGTYPLPEAQLDRFLLQIDVDYPGLEAERRVLIATTGADEVPPRAAMTGDELIAA